MKFLKMEWTKKRGAIALLATGLVVTSFLLGGYLATGNWNPWGNRHYYEVLNANFRECYTSVASGTTQCQSVHNQLFNSSAVYVEQLLTSNNECCGNESVSHSFHFIAMSNSSLNPSGFPQYGSTGLTAAKTSGDCGAEGGTNVGAGTEFSSNFNHGFLAAAGTVTDIAATAGSPATSTVVNTFTDTTAATSVDQSCLVNQQARQSANRVDLAAATFTAITLQVGDTIAITWTITWTWS